jgi:hypothetical protein
MTIYYLYIKTHTITGLKYLGQTKRNPYEYLGSGKDWTEHLSVFGNAISTDVLLASENKDDITSLGRYLSHHWRIVTSMDDFGNKIWANKIPETGGGGGMLPGKIRSQSHCMALSKAQIVSPKNYRKNQFGDKNVMNNFRGENHWYYGVKRDPKTCKKMSENHADVSGSNNGRARIIKITNPAGEITTCHGDLVIRCAELGLSVNTVYYMLSSGKPQLKRGKFKGYSVCYGEITPRSE